MRLRIPIATRWADLDAYGHVNNVEALRLLEEARIAAFWRHEGSPFPTAVLDSGPHADTHTYVAGAQIEYLAPISYQRDPLVVELWIGYLGGASIEVCYQIQSPHDEQVLVQATTTIVVVDAATGRPRRLTATERDVWSPYVETAVEFRARRRSTST